MVVIPTFILKRVYIPGSLKNYDDGFQMSLRNVLAPGTITGIGPITVDGADYDSKVITVQTQEGSRAADQINGANPLRFNINTTATLAVQGPQLASGAHDITIVIMTQEAGELKIQVSDTIQ